MMLTPEQTQITLNIIISIIVTSAFIFVISLLIKSIRKLTQWVIRPKKTKMKQGYTNYKGDTWYPDGTIWNAEKKRWEKPDYKKE